MAKEYIPDHYTRVTSVLYPYSGLQHIDKWILNNAAKRGTRVHEACEAIMEGMDAFEIDATIQGYVQSFRRWFSKGHNIVAIEKRFFCDTLNITGQVDIIVETPEGQIIIDIKTPQKPSRTWPLQGSAYAYLARKAGHNIVGIQFLQLCKYGREPTIWEYADDWRKFEMCLEIYNEYFKTNQEDMCYTL